jgi:hypothetical protein
MKVRNKRYTGVPTCSRRISATERAPWRIDAARLAMSCTAPMRTHPSRIQRRPRPPPEEQPRQDRPTIGPAAEIALKCCARRRKGGVGM